MSFEYKNIRIALPGKAGSFPGIEMDMGQSGTGSLGGSLGRRRTMILPRDKASRLSFDFPLGLELPSSSMEERTMT
jgi:hypothetical protein